jgi:molybdopterin-guanine dinucleotide biosynthesis protein A
MARIRFAPLLLVVWKNTPFAVTMKNPSIAAFVLAGGLSTRMGSDKAFLTLGAETLLDRALRLAGSACAEVRIVGSAVKFAAFGSVIEDLFPNRGPLGGIHAALISSSTEFNLMLAVDLPFIEPGFLDYLISRASSHHATVTIPRVNSRWQPLCATYRKAFAGPAAAALTQGHNRIDALFPSLDLNIIDDADLNRAGFSAEMFRNINTPADWRRAQDERPGR